MLNLSLLKGCKVTRLINSTAAGTSVINGTGLDMTGFDGVLFIGSFGALTATQVTSLKAQQSSDNGSSDAYDDLAGTNVGPMADGDGNKMLLLDILRPRKRYVRPVVVRGTANAVIDSVVAIQYAAFTEPTTQPTSVSASEYWVSPAEGTA